MEFDDLLRALDALTTTAEAERFDCAAALIALTTGALRKSPAVYALRRAAAADPTSTDELLASVQLSNAASPMCRPH